MRLLAIAYRTLPQQQGYSRADEHDLVLLGYLTFADPPLEDMASMMLPRSMLPTWAFRLQPRSMSPKTRRPSS